jgi:hypothetical protein
MAEGNLDELIISLLLIQDNTILEGIERKFNNCLRDVDERNRKLSGF